MASSKDESTSGAEKGTRGLSHFLGVEEKRRGCFDVP